MNASEAAAEAALAALQRPGASESGGGPGAVEAALARWRANVTKAWCVCVCVCVYVCVCVCVCVVCARAHVQNANADAHTPTHPSNVNARLSV